MITLPYTRSLNVKCCIREVGMEQVAQKRTVYIVLVRYLGEVDKAWKVVKVCKSREEADKVLEEEHRVDVVMERLAEYRTQILRG